MAEQGEFQVAAFDNPFGGAARRLTVREGMSIADVIRESGVPLRVRPHLEVTISRGAKSSVVPVEAWARCRPAANTHILIAPPVRGAAIGAVLSAVVAVSAPAVAGALFPTLAAGSFGLALATAGVAIVGQLAIRALIPPPAQPAGAPGVDRTYSLTQSSNDARPYEPYPTVLGRRRMMGLKTATGFSEAFGSDIYLRERMTFGYGPVALSELKIGTTSIAEFEDVEIEFLNVDRALTEAACPELTDGSVTVIGWNTGTTPMTLYPNDVAEDAYNVTLLQNEPVTRLTQINTDEVTIDFSIEGLGTHNWKGQKRGLDINIDIEYRQVGTTEWLLAEPIDIHKHKLEYFRETRNIKFPARGQYEIRVTRTNPHYNWDHDPDWEAPVHDDVALTAIRSITGGGLPSHENVAEVVIRLKASEELNGALKQFNAVVQQLGSVWDGTTWTDGVPIRHPAWQYAAALRGPQLRETVADGRIALDELKAWADEEPHWTCDEVLTGSWRLAEVLDLITAAGRARRGMSDLKYSVIRDGAAGGIVQHFTPENSWEFKGRRYLDKKLHAVRCRIISEVKDWERDEIVVYNDGYGPGNATNIELLELPGVVVTADDADQGNVYRLARYHMAVAELRPEEFTWYSDLDHVRCQMGDKVRVVHDVPLWGVGSGRVTAFTPGVSLTLDEVAETDPANSYRLRIRTSTGDEVTAHARHGNGTWEYDTLPSGDPEIGDLVLIEAIGVASVDLMITRIDHEGDLRAKLTAVPAAPEVLTADGGTIPPYNPQITEPVAFGPPMPVVLGIRSGAAAARVEADSSLTPRIGVNVRPLARRGSGVVSLGIRWREQGTIEWETRRRGAYRAEVFTGPLAAGTNYEVEVASFDSDGLSRGWAVAGVTEAHTRDTGILAKPVWTGTAGVDSITLSGPDTVELNRAGYRIYASTTASATLTLVGTTVEPHFTFVPAVGSAWARYKVAPFDYADDEGPYSDYISVVPRGVATTDLTAEVTQSITDAQDAADAAQSDASQALSAAGGVRSDFDALTDGFTGGALQDALDGVLSDANAHTDERETALNARIDNTAAAELPYDFMEGGAYWQSSANGAPGSRAPDGAWQFNTSAAEGRTAFITPADLGAFHWALYSRGVVVPKVGRRYRLTVRASIWGNPVETGQAIAAHVRRLDGNYAYIDPAVYTAFNWAGGGYQDYSLEIECTSANWSEYWRFGATFRGTDYSTDATGGQAFAMIRFEDVTDTAAIEANLTENYMTAAGVNGALAAKELKLSARIAPGGLNDGMDDLDYWVHGWVYSEADRTTAPSLEETWADVTHVSDAAEGKVLRFDRNYRVTSERYMRPVVPGQVWRVKLRMRYEVMPTLDRITIWAVGVKSDGSYAGYSTVKDFWNGSTDWQDFEAEFIPADLNIATANGAVKWCLMLTVMSQGGSATADGVALLSSIQLREASDVKLLEADLEDNYYTIADADQAISAREAVLTARMRGAAETGGDFTGGADLWASGDTGITDYTPLPDSAIVNAPGVGKVAERQGFQFVNTGKVMPLIPGHTYEFEVRMRATVDSTVTGGDRERTYLGVTRLDENGGVVGYSGLATAEGEVKVKNPLRVADGWVTLKGRYTPSEGTAGAYIRGRLYNCYNSGGSDGDTVWQVQYFRAKDISETVSAEAQITDLDAAITGPEGAIALSEKTLRAEAENVAAAALPYDFAEDATYWTSTNSGAPGAYPLDTRWSFASGANEGRKAVVSPVDYNGRIVWLMTRGVLTPVRGRRYRITVRCRLKGNPTGSGPHISIFFRRLDGDYSYVSPVNITPFDVTNLWDDYSMEVDCTSSNISPYWRAGFYVRGGDFTGDDDFEVSKVIVQDITEAHALSATVTTQGNAIADLEGNAAAGYLIKVQAGSEASLLDLIAADGSEGSVSVAKLQAQDIILEGSVGANMLTVGTGKNLLENSDFLHGETSLVFYEYGAVSNGGRGEIRDDDSLFSTPFYPTARLISLASGTTASGWVGVDFRPTNPDGTLGIGYAVIPGDFYEFHAAMNLRRVKASVRLYWYKSDGTACLDGNSDPIISYLETAAEPNLTGNGLSIGEWPRFGGIGQAPGDAAYVVPSIRLIEVVATGANQDVHIVWPMFCRTETADAPRSPYAPGGVTLIHGNRVVTGSINAEFSVTAGTITADLFAANAITTDIITITGYLDMDAVNTGMRIGKQSVVDSSDGAYFGRTEIDGNTGFGFYIGRTSGGVEQHIRMTDQDGLEIKNAEFMLGSSTASRTTYTSSTTYTIPAGTERVSFAFVGGGGGGQGGGVEGGVGSPGSNGVNTIVTLKDGTTTVATWTAAGGQGGPGPEGKTTAYSPYGNGGAGGKGAQGNSDTASGKDGADGDGGAVTTITDYDVSGLSNPKLEITIGSGGAGGGNGGDGNAGFAEVTTYGTGTFPAGPVARQQAAAGTVSCPAGTDTLFPALGSPGFWQVWGSAANVAVEIDNDGGNTLISANGTNSFFSERNRPKVISPNTALTLSYRFWPMG